MKAVTSAEKRFLTPFFIVPALAALTLCSGCVTKIEDNSTSHHTDLEQQLSSAEASKAYLAAQLEEEKSITSKLQMELVVKESDISRLKTKQLTCKEPTQPPRYLRIPVPSTRAEAVSFLAEIKTEIEETRQSPRGRSPQIFSEADDLLSKSYAELANENFDAACLLASQAIDIIHSQEPAQPVEKPPPAENLVYKDFLRPLHLEIKKHVNLREKAGVSGKRIASLPPGTSLIASGFKGNWIKIKTEKGLEGWVYFTLLSVPKP